MSSQQSISLFSFGDNEIRVVYDDKGEPWFVAREVAEALSITWSGPSKTLAAIKPEWQGVVKLPTPGGNQDVCIINEPAVYKLAFRSNKEEAERFTDWLAEDVLPSIRKTGQYNLLLKALLRPEPSEWERRFPPEFYQQLFRLFGRAYNPQRRPPVFAQITRRWIYGPVIPEDVLEEMDARKGNEKLHQWLTEEAAKAILKQIDAVALMARSSMDYRDFEARCATAFYRKHQQLGLLFPASRQLGVFH